MEVNKEEAERCRDMGAAALKAGQQERGIKLLKKSLNMYALPGVAALLSQAEKSAEKSANGGTSSTPAATPRPQTSRSASTASAASSNNGSDGRAFTDEQAKIVKEILAAKEGGRGAHYRVLGVAATATESELKKAYRKRALKLHPDKNSAPHADEAFKAVGLAYGTLSDGQKRTIYDRYGDEDPDNRGGGGGGGMARGPGGVHFRRGAGAEDINPEDLFNMFFGGGMARGGPGFHVYTNGGPGMQFGGARRPQQRAPGGGEARPEPAPAGMASLMQFLPFLLILTLSFLNFQGDSGGQSYTQNRYFSLVQTAPYTHPLTTKITTVKDIPYFVTPKFMRTYYRDRYQLAQVERLVETTYQQYLVNECGSQRKYKQQLETAAKRMPDSGPREKSLKKAAEFELSRCEELEDLFPVKQKYRSY